MVEVDTERSEVRRMLRTHAGDQFLGGDAFGLRPQHDGGAVGIVRADVVALVACHLLMAHPDVGLGVFHQVAQMQRAVGVGEGTGNKNAAHDGQRSETIMRHYAKAGATPGRYRTPAKCPTFTKNRPPSGAS